MESVTADYWVHNLNPEILHIWGPLAIRWYGVAYFLGFVVCWFLFWLYRKKEVSQMSQKDFDVLFNGGIIGVLVGGRLGYVLFYDLGYFLQHPLDILNYTMGGMSFHGGLLGVVLAILVVGYWKKLDVFKIGDLAATVVPPGLFFGRMANFINGELWGKVTDVSWAMIFPKAHWDSTQFSVFCEQLGTYANPRHPSQLYEALLEGVVLTIWLQIALWKGKQYQQRGMLSAQFLIGYGVFRTICELFREPDAALIMGISRGTFYSLFMVFSGVILMLILRYRNSRV